MKAVNVRVWLLVLAGVMLLAWIASAEPFLSVRVSGLEGVASSVLFPIDGQQVPTGDITISVGRTSSVKGITYWDLAGAERPIEWPAVIACDFLRARGVQSREVTLYGIVRQLRDGRLGDLDVGILDFTDSGNRVIIININILRTDVPAFLFDPRQSSVESLAFLSAPNEEMHVSGTFEGLAQAQGVAAWPELAADIEEVIASVPGILELPPGFAERVVRHYAGAEGASELALYFLETDTFAASDLAGSFVIDIIPANWYDVLDSFEDLLHLQAARLDSFEHLLWSVWDMIHWEQQMEFLKSFEDLLRSQADRLSSFERLLDLLHPSPENVVYIRSFETLLREQANLLASFEALIDRLR